MRQNCRFAALGLLSLWLVASLVSACSSQESSNEEPKDLKADVSLDVREDVSVDVAPELKAEVASDLISEDVTDVAADSTVEPEIQVDTVVEDKWAFCDVATDTNCIEIVKGESVFYQKIGRHPTMEFDDEGTPRTVVRLSDLIEADAIPEPDAWRYQIFGSDGFTFGGYASWDQMMQGYLEVGARRVVWEPVLELPDSLRVKDSVRIVLSPAGEQ